MKPVFLKCEDTVFYLAWGSKEEAVKCLQPSGGILDSSMSEGAGEKHLPVVECNGSKVCVRVGSVEHPMTKEHSIQWVFLETKKGGQFAYLSSDEKPEVEFSLSEGDTAVAAYAYCNLHGFWKTEIG